LSGLKEALKNEYTKQILRATGVRKVSLEQRKTPHYRMPILEEAGGWMRLNENAAKCPSIVKWVESIGARFGRVQLLHMSANTMRECRCGLHLDNNNQGNPETNGWVVRVWLELTDDPSSALVVRPTEFDRKGEVTADGLVSLG